MVCCSDKTYYTGWTTDLNRRLKAHNTGKGAKYTHSRRPVHYVYCEACDSKATALSREARIKHLSRQQKEALLNSEKNILDQLYQDEVIKNE